MRPEDIYINGGFYLTAADLKASNARRRAAVAHATPEVGPPVPVVDVRGRLAKKRLAALVASGAKRRLRRRATAKSLCTIKVTGENVLASADMAPGGWMGGVADALVAIGHPDLAGHLRKAALAARVAAATGPRSLVASALQRPYYRDYRMVCGAVETADGGMITVVAPR